MLPGTGNGGVEVRWVPLAPRIGGGRRAEYRCESLRSGTLVQKGREEGEGEEERKKEV